MRLLPTFYDLNSLVRTSSIFGLVFKSNQYGVCEAIARSQFCDIWSDIDNLLRNQRRIGQLCHAQLCTPTPSPTSSDKEQPHDHSHGKCSKKLGPGVFEGGTKIGLAEATRLMKFMKRSRNWKELVAKHIFMHHSWEHVNRGIRISDTPIINTCSITTQEALRIDRAILRYYLLLLGCCPDWIDERKNYNLLFYQFNLFSRVIPPVEDGERATMTKQEIFERKQRRAESYLQYPLGDLRDIYLVCKATLGCYPGLPGTMEQGADHIWEQWTSTDDACVQQEAELHIKRMWRKKGMDTMDLVGPDLFFEEF